MKCSTDMRHQNHEQSHNLPLTCIFMIWTKQMLLSILQPYSCLTNVQIIFAFTFLLGFMLQLKFCHHIKLANYFLWNLSWIVKRKHFHVFLSLWLLSFFGYFFFKINLLSNIDLPKKLCFLQNKSDINAVIEYMSLITVVISLLILNINNILNDFFFTSLFNFKI